MIYYPYLKLLLRRKDINQKIGWLEVIIYNCNLLYLCVSKLGILNFDHLWAQLFIYMLN